MRRTDSLQLRLFGMFVLAIALATCWRSSGFTVLPHRHNRLAHHRHLAPAG